jgi:hypothetical protein
MHNWAEPQTFEQQDIRLQYPSNWRAEAPVNEVLRLVYFDNSFLIYVGFDMTKPMPVEEAVAHAVNVIKDTFPNAMFYFISYDPRVGQYDIRFEYSGVQPMREGIEVIQSGHQGQLSFRHPNTKT